MSFSRRSTTNMAFLSLVVLLIGCAQPPADRLSQAQQLMDTAKAAGASEYATEEWSRLEISFDQAKNELANQEKVLAIFHSYVKTDEMLKRVSQDAVRVGSLAAKKRAEMKAAAETMEREARDVLASSQELLLRVSSGRNRAATKDTGNELTALKDSLSAVHRLIEERYFASAQSQVQMLKEKAAVVIDKLHETTEGRSAVRQADARITAGAAVLP